MLIGSLRLVLLGLVPGLGLGCWVFTANLPLESSRLGLFTTGDQTLDRFFLIPYLWMLAGVGLLWLLTDLGLWGLGALCCCRAGRVERGQDLRELRDTSERCVDYGFPQLNATLEPLGAD